MTGKSKDPSIPRLSTTNNNKTYSVLRNINDSHRNRIACNATAIQNIGLKAEALDYFCARHTKTIPIREIEKMPLNLIKLNYLPTN